MENNKHKILFVCIHNSARRQMAEAFLDKYGGERFQEASAVSYWMPVHESA